MQHTFLDAPGCGLRMRVHRFEDASAQPSGLTLLLVHGYMDAGGTWDLVAPHLTRAGHVLYAPDLRGFGESDPVGAGGYYHFFDYVADVDALVRHLIPEGARLGVVGHSMGGTVASLFAGACPSRVERLAILEGVGPPAMPPEIALDRTRAWLRQLQKMDRKQRPLESMDEAIRRLTANHPRVSREVLATRAKWLTRFDAEGRLVWAYDPMHRTTSPHPFQVEMFTSFLSKIECPTLFLGGGPHGYHPEDEAARVAKIPNVRSLDLPTAGHMMHWTQPEDLGRILVDFFAGRS